MLARGGIVARLAGIYGPGRSAMLRKFLEGKAAIDPQQDRYVNQVHRDDIAAALFRLLDRHGPLAEFITWSTINRCCKANAIVGLSKKLNRPVPSVGGSTSGKKRGDSNKRVSNAKLRSCGWSAAISDVRRSDGEEHPAELAAS